MRAILRLFRGENDYNFIKAWRIGFALSAALLVVSLVSMSVKGLTLGIDFEGGTSWQVPSHDLSVGDARDVMRGFGKADAKIQTVGSNIVQVQSDTSGPEETAKVTQALADAAHIEATDVAVTEVGPSWGSEISRKALRALILFFVAIGLYITWTLREWRMAVGAVVAVLHDIVLSIGVYSLLGIEVTPATVIAFLTILGFSLYDTVVVYDKIRENTPRVSVAGRMTYTEMTNLSMNQVLMRSVNTSLTAMVPVACILVVGAWIMGATTLEEFGLALMVGLIAGAYSSIFIATPIVARLKEREPQYRLVRERLGRRAGEVLASGRADGSDEEVPAAAASKSGERVPAAASSGPRHPGPAAAPASRPLPPGYSASHPPRPRKKGRR